LVLISGITTFVGLCSTTGAFLNGGGGTVDLGSGLGVATGTGNFFLIVPAGTGFTAGFDAATFAAGSLFAAAAGFTGAAGLAGASFLTGVFVVFSTDLTAFLGSGVLATGLAMAFLATGFGAGVAFLATGLAAAFFAGAAFGAGFTTFLGAAFLAAGCGFFFAGTALGAGFTAFFAGAAFFFVAITVFLFPVNQIIGPRAAGVWKRPFIKMA